MTVATCVYHCYHLPPHYNIAMYQYSLLYSLAYSHSFIRQLWYHITTAAQLSLFCLTPIITLLARRDEVVPHLAVFSLFEYLLLTILIVRQLYLYNRDTRTEGVHQG